MSGDHREQQEFGEYVRGEDTLVISLEGLNWFCGRRRRRRRTCSDREEGKKKRDEELQLWTSSGHMTLPDERLRCLCVSDLWRNTGLRTSSSTQGPEDASWTTLVLKTRDVFTLIARNVQSETQRNTATMDRPQECVVFCSEDVPSRPFSDCRTIAETTASRVSDDNDPAAFSTSDPNNNSVVGRRGTTRGDNFNLRTSKSLPAESESSGKDRNVKMRKSVSFDDDVMVYLFDQESPTMELHSGPDVTLEDNGLEWEDDFSALEESFSVGRSWSLPVSRPQRYVLSQTCLFLTHVTESDLEL